MQDTLARAVVLCGQVPKHGHADDECQDALELTHTQGTLRIAVADGASQGAGQALWARLIARASVVTPPPTANNDAPLRGWLVPLREEWSRLRAGEPVPANAPWFVNRARLLGAASTLLCVELDHRGDTPRWSATAVGDTCVLIDARARGAGVRSFPISRSEDFGLRPPLLYTRDGEGPPTVPETDGGELGPGDILLTASDALAKALLDRPALLDELDALRCDADVVVWLRDLQARDWVEDDDLSLVLVRVEVMDPTESARLGSLVAPDEVGTRLHESAPDATDDTASRPRIVARRSVAEPGRRASSTRHRRGDGSRDRRAGGFAWNAVVTLVILAVHDLVLHALYEPPKPCECTGVSDRAHGRERPDLAAQPVGSRQTSDIDAAPNAVGRPGIPSAAEPGGIPPQTVLAPSVQIPALPESPHEVNWRDPVAQSPAEAAQHESNVIWICCMQSFGCVHGDTSVEIQRAELKGRGPSGKSRGLVAIGRYDVLDQSVQPWGHANRRSCALWLRIKDAKFL